MSDSPGLVDAPSFSGCFHCGLPVPDGAHYPIQFEGETKQACCRGCQAVAQTIIDSGQGAYYTHRTALPATPQQAEAEQQEHRERCHETASRRDPDRSPGARDSSFR